MSVQNEIWQVMVNGEVYEADTYTLKQWVAEGRILATDKVKKGNLSWIEANRVPALRRVFTGEEIPQPEPPPPATPQVYSAQENYNTAGAVALQPVYNPGMSMPALSTVCYYHPQLPPDYICRVCSATFCRSCTKFVGNIPVCQLCGELCGPYADVKQETMKWVDQHSGFGFYEFSRALRYPLKDIVALLIAATVYGFLLLGSRYALGMGSIIAKVLGYTMLFGCTSLIIRHVAMGKINEGSFMPDFSTFSFLDDVVNPMLLGLGIMLVTLGPAILLLSVTLYGMVSGGVSLTHLDPETILRVGGTLLVVGLVGGLWAAFYYPMALMVAGFSQDFKSVVNPLVGIDTIRRMGAVYLKAFLMCLGAWTIWSVLVVIITVVGQIVYIPVLSSLVACMFEGIVTFYINIAVACILGLSLFKCADQLGICTD